MFGWIFMLMLMMLPTFVGMFFRKPIISNIIAITYIPIAVIMAVFEIATKNTTIWLFVGACAVVSLGTFFTKQTHYLKITKWRVQKRLVTDPRK